MNFVLLCWGVNVLKTSPFWSRKQHMIRISSNRNTEGQWHINLVLEQSHTHTHTIVCYPKQQLDIWFNVLCTMDKKLFQKQMPGWSFLFTCFYERQLPWTHPVHVVARSPGLFLWSCAGPPAPLGSNHQGTELSCTIPPLSQVSPVLQAYTHRRISECNVCLFLIHLNHHFGWPVNKQLLCQCTNTTWLYEHSLRLTCLNYYQSTGEHCLLFSSLHQCLAEVLLGIAVIWTVLQGKFKVCYSLYDAAFVSIPVNDPIKKMDKTISI